MSCLSRIEKAACAVQHGFHHQRRNIQAESQTGQAVTLAIEDHRLVWPQGFVDADLQVGLFQVDQGHIDALSAPLAQLLAAHIRVRRMVLNVGAQLTDEENSIDDRLCDSASMGVGRPLRKSQAEDESVR
ncbi:hypothetical protein T05_6529, partial [Trichinella murrelli]